MTDTVRTEAAQTLAEVEKVTAVILPEPGREVVPLDAAPAPQAEEIRKRMAQLDMTNTQSIISFGSGAQAELQVISCIRSIDTLLFTLRVRWSLECDTEVVRFYFGQSSAHALRVDPSGAVHRRVSACWLFGYSG